MGDVAPGSRMSGLGPGELVDSGSSAVDGPIDESRPPLRLASGGTPGVEDGDVASHVARPVSVTVSVDDQLHVVSRGPLEETIGVQEGHHELGRCTRRGSIGANLDSRGQVVVEDEEARASGGLSESRAGASELPFVDAAPHVAEARADEAFVGTALVGGEAPHAVEQDDVETRMALDARVGAEQLAEGARSSRLGDVVVAGDDHPGEPAGVELLSHSDQPDAVAGGLDQIAGDHTQIDPDVVKHRQPVFQRRRGFGPLFDKFADMEIAEMTDARFSIGDVGERLGGTARSFTRLDASPRIGPSDRRRIGESNGRIVKYEHGDIRGDSTRMSVGRGEWDERPPAS